jgi:hypothetical protein
MKSIKAFALVAIITSSTIAEMVAQTMPSIELLPLMMKKKK